jgi:hypothetical protein
MSRRVRIARFVFFVVLALAARGPSAATAQETVDLDRYRLIPQLSVLRETGGFAGVSNRYRVMGKFDLARPANRLDVSIENAEVWGSIISPFPTPAIVTDLDALLNLEGLVGERLATIGFTQAYRFTGKIADGSRIELFAMQLGPWLGLRGFTTPPPNSADFFEYELRAVARQRPVADFNDDGVVDAADLAAWTASAGPSFGNQPASGGDFLAWQRQLGETPPLEVLDEALSAALAAAQPAVTAVPEPGSLALASLGCVVVAAGRVRKKSLSRRAC